MKTTLSLCSVGSRLQYWHKLHADVFLPVSVTMRYSGSCSGQSSKQSPAHQTTCCRARVKSSSQHLHIGFCVVVSTQRNTDERERETEQGNPDQPRQNEALTPKREAAPVVPMCFVWQSRKRSFSNPTDHKTTLNPINLFYQREPCLRVWRWATKLQSIIFWGKRNLLLLLNILEFYSIQETNSEMSPNIVIPDFFMK